VATNSLSTRQRRVHEALVALFSTRTGALPADLALIATRVALTWIFIYYGAGKLFGSFNGMGIHGTALYFSNTAHLHPGGFFAVLGGVIEFGGGIAMALGLGSRLVGLALFGDMVMAMITITWSTGIDSRIAPPGYQVNLAVGVLALVIVAFGAGRFSIDALLERRVVAAGGHSSSGPAGSTSTLTGSPGAHAVPGGR
jgi:putative oxidoreductase